MRIDLPQCNFKKCMHCFDGNCVDKNRFDTCEYTYALAEICNAKDELKHSYLKQHDSRKGYEKIKAENEEYKKRLDTKETILVLQETTMSMLSSDKDTLIDKVNEQNKEIERLKAELEQSAKFKEYFMNLYDQGLEVSNWHLNGDTEPLTIFIDSALEQ